MNNETQDELKKVIRAILIAEKSSQIGLGTLERRFAEIVAIPMPLYGYPDTVALLKSLTDTVLTVCYILYSALCTFTFD